MTNPLLSRDVSLNLASACLQLDELEYTCLYLCRESRRQVARRVKVAESTPHALWCRAESSSAGGGGVGDGSRRNQHDVTSDNTSVTIDGFNAESVESSGVIPEIPMENIVYLPDFSPDQSAPSSSAPCGETHQEQNRRTELQANTGEWEKGGSPTATNAGFTRSYNAVDEVTVCSEGGCRKADYALAGLRRAPTVATGSLVYSRVPLARVTSIIWTLPTTVLTAGGFRWRDGVTEIEFTDYIENVDSTHLDDLYPENDPPEDDASEMIEVVSVCFDGLSEPGYVPLPPGLMKVYFEANWNIKLHGTPGSFPDSLEYISFPRRFNQPLNEHGVSLPRGLREIELGGNFDRSLIGVDWPPLLQKLTFRDGFDQPLDGVRFPPGLREIRSLGKYNRDLSGVIWPKGLEDLAFGDMFDQALGSPDVEGGASRGRKHALPDGLKNLHLGDSFDHSLSGSELPDGLEVLSLGESFDFTASPVRWPSALKHLYVQSPLLYDDEFTLGTLPMELPPKLERLIIYSDFNSPLTTVAWPPTLKVLDLGCSFDRPIGKDGDVALLPDGLEELRLGVAFNHSIKNIRLPAGLKCLIAGNEHSAFNQDLTGVMWPPGLEELALGDCFDQPMEGTTFPETLRELSFGTAFSYSLQGVTLPDGLARLSFGPHYPGCLILELDWPRSLRSLHVGGLRTSCRDDLANFVAGLPCQDRSSVVR